MLPLAILAADRATVTVLDEGLLGVGGSFLDALLQHVVVLDVLDLLLASCSRAPLSTSSSIHVSNVTVLIIVSLFRAHRFRRRRWWLLLHINDVLRLQSLLDELVL